MMAGAVHAVAPMLLMCVAASSSTPQAGQAVSDAGGARSSSIQVLLLLCVLLDGTAAALPLLSRVVPGMITLTAQVAAVSGAAAWSAACTLLLVLCSVEHGIDSTTSIVVWVLADTFGGLLSIADAACGGVGSTGVMWKSVSAILVLSAVVLRLLLLLLLLVPHLGGSARGGLDDDDDSPDDILSAAEEPCANRGVVVWGPVQTSGVLGKAHENSNFLAHIFITWPARMLSAARVRVLFHGDVSEAPPESHAGVLLDAFCSHASPSHASTHKPGWQRLASLLWSVHGISWSMGLGLRVVGLILGLGALLMLRKLLCADDDHLDVHHVDHPGIDHLLSHHTPVLRYTPGTTLDQVVRQGTGSDDTDTDTDTQHRLISVGALVLSMLVSAVLAAQGAMCTAVEECKVRNVLWALLYRTTTQQQPHTASGSARRFSCALDVDTACKGVGASVAVLEAVLDLLLSALLLQLVIPIWGGVAGAMLLAAALLRLALMVGGSVRAGKWAEARKSLAQRLAACDEVLDGFIALKCLSWQDAMAQRVLVLRRREQRALASLLKLDWIGRVLGGGGALVAGGILSFSLLASVFSSSSLSPQAPSAANFLIALALVVRMCFRTQTLGSSTWILVRARNALHRLDAALDLTHTRTRPLPVRPPLPTAGARGAWGTALAGGSNAAHSRHATEAQVGIEDGDILLRLHNITFSWHLPSHARQGVVGADAYMARHTSLSLQPETPARVWRVLLDVNLVVRGGERVAVVGGAGSGKSTLLMGLLGEAAVEQPTAGLGCTQSFVSRQMFIATARPWVEEQLSIQVNIMGWHPMDQRILSQTLDVCGLRPLPASSSALESADKPSRGTRTSYTALPWPQELRERVGLARAVYAAALASASADEGSSGGCILLLDEPLASVSSAQVRAKQLSRLLKCSLLARAAIVFTSRDSKIVHGANKVVLLRASRALNVAPPPPPAPPRPEPLSGAGAGAGLARPADLPAAAAAGAGTDSGSEIESSGVTWHWQVEADDDSLYQHAKPSAHQTYVLLDEADGDDVSDDSTQTPPSSTSSPHHLRTPRRVAGHDAGGLLRQVDERYKDGLNDGLSGISELPCEWAHYLITDARPHGAGGVCNCGSTLDASCDSALDASCGSASASASNLLNHAHRPTQLATSRHAHAGAGAAEQALVGLHLVGVVLLHLLHGYQWKREQDDGKSSLSPSLLPASLMLVHALCSAACTSALYVLVFVFAWGPLPYQASGWDAASRGARTGGASSTAQAWCGDSLSQVSSQVSSSSCCPPWTPCSSNCSARVAQAWQGVSQHLTPDSRGDFVWVYLGMVGAVALLSFVATVACLSRTASSTFSTSTSLFRLFCPSWWRGRGGMGAQVHDDDDLVTRVVLRCAASACAPLLKSGMRDKIKCGLGSAHAYHPALSDVVSVASGLRVREDMGAGEALVALLQHGTYIVTSITCLLLLWPSLALPICGMVLYVGRLGLNLSSARIQLDALWRAAVCGRLDRLWLALRNGVEMRSSPPAIKAEETALHESLALESGVHLTLAAAEVMVMLRVDFLGLALCSLPALVTALTFRRASSAETPNAVDQWVLVGISVVQGLWCWSHAHSFFDASRSIASALPGLCRLHTLAEAGVLADESCHRAACGAAMTKASAASAAASTAIHSALQKRGLAKASRGLYGSKRSLSSGTKRALYSTSTSVSSSNKLNTPAASSFDKNASGPASGSTCGAAECLHEVQLDAVQLDAVQLDAVQLCDGVLALGADGAYTTCNGFTDPLSVRVPPGGLLWVGGASVVSSKYGKESRHGLAAVLAGWGTVAAGRVLLGDDDLSLLPLSEVRRQMVVVPRDSMLLSGTVRENLDLVRRAQGDWQLWAALEQCLFADTVRSWPGKLDCVIQAAGCGSKVCAGLWGGEARKCLCQYDTTAVCHNAAADSVGINGIKGVGVGVGVYVLTLHQRQLLGLARAVLAAALNGSRVLVIEGLDELVDKDTQDLVLSRQLALGMTTLVISSHAGNSQEAPPIVHMPGALGMLVHADGQVRHYVGGRPDAHGTWAGMSDKDNANTDGLYVPSADRYDETSESNREYEDYSDTCVSRGKKNTMALSVAGQAGKVIKSGFKGIRKAGRMLGRTVAQAPSLLPARSNSTDSH